MRKLAGSCVVMLALAGGTAQAETAFTMLVGDPGFLAEAQARDARIKVLYRGGGQGPAAARNAGLRLATAPVVGFRRWARSPMPMTTRKKSAIIGLLVWQNKLLWIL